MVARLAYDKGISTDEHSAFAYNGVAPSISFDEMRDILGYNVTKKVCKTQEGEDITGIHYLATDKGHIVEMATAVGNEFSVAIQPTELADIVQFIVGNVAGAKIGTVATMYNGATSFAVITQGDAYSVMGDNSPHYVNAVISNPLTRGKVHIVQSNVRVICENTLALACSHGKGYHISHTTNAQIMCQHALNGVRASLLHADATRRVAQLLGNTDISQTQIDATLDALYPLPVIGGNEPTNALTRIRNRRDAIMAQFESDDTFSRHNAWAFLNAITYGVEHNKSKQARVDYAQMAWDNMVGDKADFKSRALDALLVSVGKKNEANAIEAEFKIVA